MKGLRVLGLVVVLAAAAGGYWMGQSHVPAVPGDTATEAGTGERRILYYRNPMGLPDTSPVPKKDSMGMDYVPVYADEATDDAGVVVVSPARIQTLGVTTALVDHAVLDEALRAVGRVEVDERRIAEIAPRFEGWIEKLYVSATGDPVRRGQPLFTVYSPELVSARKELAIAENLKLDAPGADPDARTAARRLEQATRERLRNWGVNDAGGAHQTFRSPVAGVVLDKTAVEGMRFMPGTSVFRVADLSRVWVIADVYEQDLERVRVGQRAQVTIDALPDRQFEARVTYLYPTLNAPTRTTPVRLELDNRDGLLRPGMFAHVDLATGGNTPRLVVPTSAVIDTGMRQIVLLALDGGRFKPQPVTLGLRGRDRVEVREGLEAGQRVVVSANFLIDAESNLKAALDGFGAGEAGDGHAPGAAAAPLRHRAVGKLDSIDVSAGSVTVTHEPIAELKWPAMTMDFNLASPHLLHGYSPGDAIRFEFEERAPGDYTIVDVKPADAGGH